jgi:hypothetical protein
MFSFSVWQLMRKYTLSLLSKLSPDGTPIVETEILTWANQRLKDAGKPIAIKHFQVTKVYFMESGKIGVSQSHVKLGPVLSIYQQSFFYFSGISSK